MISDDDYLIHELRESEVRLKAFIGKRVAQPVDVDDVFQETVTRVLAKSKQIVITEPVPYAYRVASNVISDGFRNSRDTTGSESIDQLVADLPLHETAFDAKKQAAILIEEISKLPDKRRAILIHRQLHGHSYADIANDYGITETAARQHVSRAIRILHLAIHKLQEPALKSRSLVRDVLRGSEKTK